MEVTFTVAFTVTVTFECAWWFFAFHPYLSSAGRGDATELSGAQQYAAHRRKLSEVRVVYP